MALLLLAAPPLTAAATVATHPGTVTGPGMERAPVRPFVSGPVTAQVTEPDRVETKAGSTGAPLALSGSVTFQGRYRGHTAEEWAARFRRRTRQYQNVRRVMLRSPHVIEAINLSCIVYGQCQTLWRKAECETGGTYSPRSLNSSSSASGLFQFLPSTWRSTPYGRFDVFSPYANSLAAGWMHAHGRGSEWACR